MQKGVPNPNAQRYGHTYVDNIRLQTQIDANNMNEKSTRENQKKIFDLRKNHEKQLKF